MRIIIFIMMNVLLTNDFDYLPIGMHYLSYDIENYDYLYLLGVVKNNISKYTIISAMIFIDKYYLFSKQNIPLTYIVSGEVNYYFRNMGIYKRMCNEIINYINMNQPIIFSKESKMGFICNTSNILKNSLLNSGFKMPIFIDDCNLHNNKKLYKMVCNRKILKK